MLKALDMLKALALQQQSARQADWLVRYLEFALGH